MKPDHRAEPVWRHLDRSEIAGESTASAPKSAAFGDTSADDAPDTLPAPPPVPSVGPRTRPSSPRALRIADILAEGRRAAGLPDEAES